MNPRRRLLLHAPLAAWPGLAGALTRRPLAFPRDHGSHPDSRTEWWYLTGWLQEARSAGDPRQRPIAGFQLTFFRSRTGFGADLPSAFAARQLLFAHAALTDLGDPAHGRLLHDQRSARAGLGLAEAATTDTDVVIDRGPREWTLRRRGGAGPSVYDARWRNAEVDLQLSATATQPLLLQGEAGWSRKGPRPGQASHYYSQPQLAVRGTLMREGRERAVAGRAWLDHEWSEALLDADAVGWDWIGFNLFDGSALTAFRLRRADGSALHAGGSWRAQGGTVQAFASEAVRFVPGRLWRSAATGANYPVEWHIETPAGRHLVRALADDQELDSRASTGAVYWEGLSELLDERGARIGLGYLELTGYVSRLRL